MPFNIELIMEDRSNMADGGSVALTIHHFQQLSGSRKTNVLAIKNLCSRKPVNAKGKHSQGGKSVLFLLENYCAAEIKMCTRCITEVKLKAV